MTKRTKNAQTLTKNEIIAQNNAMFKVTSNLSKDNVSSIPSVKEAIQEQETQLKNAEIEKMHVSELSEAKELGLEEENIIIESTPNEISNDFSQKLEESQMRYLEAIEDRDNYKKQIEKLKTENSKLKNDLNLLNSEYDCYKTDTSREIVNYKINVESLEEKISTYEQNIFNYKLEIAGLKTEIANLENSIKESNNDEKKNASSSSRSPLQMYSRPNLANSRPSNNGYSSWN